MSPSVFVEVPKKNSGPSTNMAVVGHLWFFLLSHLLRNYLMDSMNLSHVILDELITRHAYVLQMWKIRQSPSQKWSIRTYLSNLWKIQHFLSVEKHVLPTYRKRRTELLIHVHRLPPTVQDCRLPFRIAAYPVCICVIKTNTGLSVWRHGDIMFLTQRYFRLDMKL